MAPSLPFPPEPPIRTRGETYTHGHPYDARNPLDYSQPTTHTTDRQRHLQYLHSLMHVLLQRHPTLVTTEAKEANATRIGRIIRVLWSRREWRQGELWKEGLAWAGLDTIAVDLGQDDQMDVQNEEHANQEHAAEEAAAKRRIAFLKAVASRRRGLVSRLEVPRNITRAIIDSNLYRLPLQRPLLLAHRIQELVSLGQWKEALDEIEL